MNGDRPLADTPQHDDLQQPFDVIGRTETVRHGAAHFRTPTESAETPPIDPEGKGEKRHRTAKGWAIALGIIAALYLVGVAVWSNIYLPGTTINGRDVSLRTPAAVSQEYNTSSAGYTLTVSGDGVAMSIKRADINLVYSYDDSLKAALAQRSAWAWPVSIFQPEDLEADYAPTFDADMLKSAIASAVAGVNANATQPKSATLAYDSGSQTYQIQAEQYGTAVDPDAVFAEISSALSGYAETLELGQESLVKPAIVSGDEVLTNAQQTANVMLAATQTLTTNGSTVDTVGPDLISQWIDFANDMTPSLNDTKVANWAQNDFSKKEDSVGASRTYTTPYGKQVSVSGGTYGWNVNGNELASSISANIKAGTAASIDIPWKQTASTVNPGGADWGKRYIDVDLAEQHARMYDESGSLVWETDIVSGNSTRGHGTPEGVYFINNKAMNQTLIGLDENHDGDPDYKTPVTYWLPFVDNLVAFHDAWWRGRFGGSIYQSNGSHGCINLPSEKAKALYGLAQVGDVVVVHK